MATTILSLPNELLEDISSYLDWDSKESLTPVRPDIVAISLTCSQLRLAVLPILFRHVKLVLRWDEGSLIEPKLFGLRRSCPQLMRFVRTVHVETRFGHVRNHDARFAPFRVPENLHDWLDPSESVPADYPQHLRLSYRERVETVARTLWTSSEYAATIQCAPHDLREHASAVLHKLFGEDSALALERGLGANTAFDEGHEEFSPAPNHLPGSCVVAAGASSAGTPALGPPPGSATLGIGTGAAGLIAPPNIQLPGAATSSALQAARIRTQREKFRDLRLKLDALVLVMLCFPPTVRYLIFQAEARSKQDALQNRFALNVAATVCDIFGDRLETLNMMVARDPRIDSWQGIITPHILEQLRTVKHLTLDLNTSSISYAGQTTFPNELSGWHAMSENVVHLSLWNIHAEPQPLVDFIKAFTHLQRLSMHSIWLSPPFNVVRQAGGSILLWLSFLIDLRRQLPTVAIELASMQGPNVEALKHSATRWLLEEAIPIGCTVNYERETRLLEDFQSFQPLWAAEDSQRGELAKEHRKDGKLVDMAMGSRWRGLSKGVS